MSALRHEITDRVHFQTADTKASGLQQAGQFKEESAARISESFSGSCNAESLARKSAAEQLEVRHGAGGRLFGHLQ